MKITADMLKQVSLLSSLTEKELIEVAAQLRGKMFTKRDFILNKGDSHSELLFLLAGKLQVVDYTNQGKEVVLHSVNVGEYFGELSVIDGHKRSASVIASEDSIVAFLSKSNALTLFYETPQVAKELLVRFAQVIRQSSSRQVLLNNTSAYARVYMMLLNLLENGSQTERGVIDNMPTQQELAGMVNTSRETVSRAIRSLVKQGIIKKEKRHIIMLRQDKLEGMAFSDDK